MLLEPTRGGPIFVTVSPSLELGFGEDPEQIVGIGRRNRELIG